MNFRLPTVFLLCAATFNGLRAADDDTQSRTNMKEVLRARMAEDAKKQPAKPAPTKSQPALTPGAAPATAPVSTTSPASVEDKTEKPPAPTPAPIEAKSSSKKSNAKNGQQPATVLPQVEVKKARITVLDQQLAKQDEDIARERKNLKASEADIALNDMKVAKPLSIFGGESSQFRQRVASERVELMEAEKDVMEAIARAKTKEEKAELQKQLDQLRAFRRDLDKSLR